MSKTRELNVRTTFSTRKDRALSEYREECYARHKHNNHFSATRLA